MTPRARIEPEASVELREAVLWYERQRRGLGEDFLGAVDKALEFISSFSHAGSAVSRVADDLPVRRVPVKRFPFHVVYLKQSEVIRVLAFAHDRRSPGYWRSRVTK